MDSLAAWELFLYTGLPQVYNEYCKLREEERQETEKSA